MDRVDAPTVTLDGEILRCNVRAWQRHTGAAVRAVVKADGYGFGLERVARELRDVADGFIVSDARDLGRLREISDAPAASLADIGPAHAVRVAELRGIVNVSRVDSLRALTERSDAASLRLRVGLRLAAGWSAIEERDAAPFAERLAKAQTPVELWTHLSNEASYAADRNRFERFVAVFREAGARVAAVDLGSTYSAARGDVGGASVRIGAGLFGAAMNAVNGVRCAIGVRASVVERMRSGGALRAGYGLEHWEAGTPLTVIRCGYADGFPRTSVPYGTIVSVGMQYCVLRQAIAETTYALLGPGDDLDALARACGVLAHQIVTALGTYDARAGAAS